MIVRIIAQYLETHKRLVVPGLGAFLVKEETRTVVFTELMSRDDGVLQGLLVEEGHSALAAAGELSRFVFEVRHAVESGQQYEMKGFGVLRAGGNNTIRFDHRPPTAVLPDVALEIEPNQVEKVRPVKPVEEPRRVVQPRPQPQTEVVEPAPNADESKPLESHGEEPKRGRVEEHEEEHEEQDIFVEDEVEVEPVDEQNSLDDEDPFDIPADEELAPRRVRRVSRPVAKPKMDRFLILAIAAAVLALLAIGFGMYSSSLAVDEEPVATPAVEAVDSLAEPVSAQ